MLMVSPLRRLFEDPDKILREHIEPGMTVVDIGCAMGFFSLPAAQMVGEQGKVVCIDLQERMIQSLNRRVSRAKLTDRIETRVCSENDLAMNDLTGAVDLVIAFHVIHEVPDVPGLVTQVYRVLKPGAKFFVTEPKGHVSEKQYQKTETIVREAGFSVVARPHPRRSWATVFVKH